MFTRSTCYIVFYNYIFKFYSSSFKLFYTHHLFYLFHFFGKLYLFFFLDDFFFLEEEEDDDDVPNNKAVLFLRFVLAFSNRP